MKPQLSVLIPVRNCAATLRRCIDSVLASRDIDFEVIVLENGSTDCTTQLLEAYRDNHRVRVMHRDSRQGMLSLRLECARLARADIVAFVDADDAVDPDAFATALKVMADADIVQMLMIDEYYVAHHRILSRRHKCANDVSRLSLGVSCRPKLFNPALIGKLMRKKLLETVPALPYTGFWGEDRLIMTHIALARNPRVMFAPEAKYRYRFGGDSNNSLAKGRAEEYREVHTLLIDMAKQYGALHLVAEIEQSLDKLMIYDEHEHRNNLITKIKHKIKNILR